VNARLADAFQLVVDTGSHCEEPPFRRKVITQRLTGRC
jgi:hypothetical protein